MRGPTKPKGKGMVLLIGEKGRHGWYDAAILQGFLSIGRRPRRKCEIRERRGDHGVG